MKHYNFLDVTKEVDRIAERIWKKYHIESITITEKEPNAEVTALIVNDWQERPERNLFTFEIVAHTKLEVKHIEIL